MQTINISQTPTSSASQMQKIDQEMVEKFHTSIQTMMQKATQSTFDVLSDLTQIKDQQIIILAGKGNNGGDGIGAAIHIKESGGFPTIILTQSQDLLSPDALQQLSIAQANQIPIITYHPDDKYKIQSIIRKSNYIIDALIGYNLKGNPKDPIASLIRMANESKLPIMSIDIPSGLTPDKGRPSNPTIKATATLALSTVKKGLIRPSAKKFVGQLYISDLGIPKKLYKKTGIDYQNIFDNHNIYKVER